LLDELVGNFRGFEKLTENVIVQPIEAGVDKGQIIIRLSIALIAELRTGLLRADHDRPDIDHDRLIVLALRRNPVQQKSTILWGKCVTFLKRC
jgi:hypothetical protein